MKWGNALDQVIMKFCLQRKALKIMLNIHTVYAIPSATKTSFK